MSSPDRRHVRPHRRDLVALDADLGADKARVIERLAGASPPRAAPPTPTACVAARAGARGPVGHRPARRHRDPALPLRAPSPSATLAFARLSPKVDFGAPDGPADLVFLIAAPDRRRRRAHEAALQPGPGAGHARLRRRAARRARPPRSSRWSTASSTRPPSRPPRPLPLRRSPPRSQCACSPPRDGTIRLAQPSSAVTACPTGIAHTYMAADSLVAAGERAGVTVHVETQGSSGSTPLDPARHRRRRRRHLRHRRRRQGPRALRRQARHRLRRQARHQRARRDGRRRRCAPPTNPNAARVERHRRRRRRLPPARRRASAGAPGCARSC